MNNSDKNITTIFRLACSVLIGLSCIGSASARPMIDVHVHTSARYYQPLLDLLSSYGVSRYVNLSGGHGDELIESLRYASIVAPQIAVCANIDWSKLAEKDFADQAVTSLEYAARAGAQCLKISKALGLYLPDPKAPQTLLPIDDPRLNPIWQSAGRLNFPIFIHTGDPKAFFEPLTPDNERYDELSVHPDWSFHGPNFPKRRALLDARNRVFKRHPQTQFVAVHFANNPEDIDDVDRMLDEHPNVVVDIAARVPELGRHAPHRIRQLFVKHQDRILLGTDLGFSPNQIMLGSVGREKPTVYDIFEFYARHEAWLSTDKTQMPHPTPIQGRWRIDGASIPSKVLDKIYWKNALRVIWKASPDANVELNFLNGVPGMSKYYPN